MPVIAGSERRHRPRGRLYAAAPLQIESGLPILPELVLWALALEEGDLLTVSPGLGTGSFHFQSYLAALESILEAVGSPWTYIEQRLREPMAAVGPKGTLLLPEKAAGLVGCPPGTLVLHSDWRSSDSSDFVLQVEKQTPSPSVLSVAKEYTLPILSGGRVLLPEEALWLTGLRGGGRLACQTYLGEAHFEPAKRVGHPGERFWVELEPDGALTLPESMRKYAEERPFDQVLLSVSSPQFQIRLWADWGGEGALR